MSQSRVNGGRSGAGRAARMARWIAPRLVPGLACLWGWAGGCAKQQPTTVVKPPEVHTGPAPRMETDPDARVRELQRQAAEFSALAKTLPAYTAQENREKMRQVFASLSQLLPLVQIGPRGGVFDHQVSVVALTRTELASQSPDLSINPVVDSGVRAVYNALDDAQHNGYYEDPKIRDNLDQLAGKVRDLDSTRGAVHYLVWAEALNLSSDVITQMGKTLADRLSDTGAAPPSTNPATAPGEPTPATPPTRPAP